MRELYALQYNPLCDGQRLPLRQSSVLRCIQFFQFSFLLNDKR